MRVQCVCRNVVAIVEGNQYVSRHRGRGWQLCGCCEHTVQCEECKRWTRLPVLTVPVATLTPPSIPVTALPTAAIPPFPSPTSSANIEPIFPRFPTN